MSQTTDHRCAAGRNCRDSVVEDGNRQAAVIVDAVGLCEKCTEAVGWAVRDMADTWMMLHGSIGDQSRRGGGQRVKGSRSAPINLNTDVDALKASIVEWMVAATAPISELLNVSDPRPVNHSDTEALRVVEACTRILSPHVHSLIGLPAGEMLVWLGSADTENPGESLTSARGGDHGRGVVSMTGVDVALKLMELRGRARSLLALTTPHDKLPFPCPHCNTYELVRSHRSINLVGGKSKNVDQIDCGNCALQWPYERYRQLCRIWVREDELEREKLQKQLESEKERRELAEWLLAKRDWQFSLALECTDVSASAFAATVLADEIPEEDAYMSDKDIAALVGVGDSTIRTWATRGLITRHAADDGSTVFHAREVWEHAKSTAGGRAATNRRLTNVRKATEGATA